MGEVVEGNEGDDEAGGFFGWGRESGSAADLRESEKDTGDDCRRVHFGQKVLIKLCLKVKMKLLIVLEPSLLPSSVYL